MSAPSGIRVPSAINEAFSEAQRNAESTRAVVFSIDGGEYCASIDDRGRGGLKLCEGDGRRGLARGPRSVLVSLLAKHERRRCLAGDQLRRAPQAMLRCPPDMWTCVSRALPPPYPCPPRLPPFNGHIYTAPSQHLPAHHAKPANAQRRSSMLQRSPRRGATPTTLPASLIRYPARSRPRRLRTASTHARAARTSG